MRKILISLSVIVVACAVGFYALFHNGMVSNAFRSCEKNITSSYPQVNTKGLDELNVSGSSRVALYHLKWSLRHVQGPIYLIDLTDGKIKYYRTLESSLFKERRLNPEFVYTLRRILIGGSSDILPQYLEKESDVAPRFGLIYQAFYIPRRHIPSQEMVDKIVAFAQILPKDAWLHAHCDAGRGRTTMFMIMMDIIKNGHQVSVEEIVERQYRLGGVDMFDTKVWVNGHYTQEQLQARKDFIISFHKYVTDPKGYGQQTWSAWCDKNDVHHFSRFQIG